MEFAGRKVGRLRERIGWDARPAQSGVGKVIHVGGGFAEASQPGIPGLDLAQRQKALGGDTLARTRLRQVDLGTQGLRCVCSRDRHAQGDCQQVLPLSTTASTGTLGAILEPPWCFSGSLQLTAPLVAAAKLARKGRSGHTAQQFREELSA
jgi:hypothetical protein